MEWMNTSWEWVLANASFFSGLGTVAMAIIWAVYLQLIVHNFLSGKKPEMIINRCNGHDFNAHCMLGNMSTGTAFIETIIVRLRSNDETYYADVTDINSREDIEGDLIAPENLRHITRQGPINQGEYIDAGRFGMLIERVATLNSLTLDESSQPVDQKPFTHFEILVISIYGQQRHPVGARRSFTISRDQQGKYYFAPEKPMTRQLASRRERKELKSWQSALNNPENAV
ncbi:hypothetical protein GCM10010082_05520 [Kushneria pakistanensis]|uniref:Uncharacterized protein n=1 Tax=Kushneria pakistanensis TaxID=1508770 RepID=A0ABQ3FBW4_9GAMM|nr:hypothetical protein [Kushneria pakistanensis]GHC17303.1 hypothetical protein GCM10010082_05520 [Kushneria pakistanensis]